MRILYIVWFFLIMTIATQKLIDIENLHKIDDIFDMLDTVSSPAKSASRSPKSVSKYAISSKSPAKSASRSLAKSASRSPMKSVSKYAISSKPRTTFV